MHNFLVNINFYLVLYSVSYNVAFFHCISKSLLFILFNKQLFCYICNKSKTEDINFVNKLTC